MWKLIASRFSLMKSKKHPDFEDSVRDLRDKLAEHVRAQFGNFLDECRREIELQDQRDELEKVSKRAALLREQRRIESRVNEPKK